MNSQVAQQWIEVWRQEKQSDRTLDVQGYRRYTRIPRWWRYIYDLGQLSLCDRILEVGCGSGTQLIPLAAQGYQVTGLDCSPDALDRCRRILAELENFQRHTLSVSLMLGDITQMQPTGQFSLVLSFGVIEHFTDRSERLGVLRKLCEWTALNGTCVNCVPNGMHPLRQRMREDKLGGYNIPEIDYGLQSLKEEMLEAGFAEVRVVPLDLFGYRLVCMPPHSLAWLFFRGLNLFFKALPHHWLPLTFRERHAYILACAGRKTKQ